MKSFKPAVIGGIFLALSLWSAPRLLALYHQEQGARLIIQALQAEGRAEAGDFWLEPAPLTQPEAQSLAKEALAHFEAAIAAAPYNFQARRWLGRAALLQNRPIDAVTTLSDAVRQRPRNPLGWWDLGLAYERLAPLSKSKEPSAGTLAMEVDNFTDDVMIISGLVTATLDTIMSETPAIPIETPYCNQGTAPQSCFIAPTVWEMPDAPQEQFWTPAEAIRRTVLFMHPPAQSTLTVTLPMTPTTLLFWLGMDPAAWAWLGDGVIYRLQVNGQPVFEQALTPAEAIAGWQPGQVDLTPWAGRTIRLTLATDAGPVGDGTGDWAGWGDVQGVPLDVAPCLQLSCRDRATAAWKEGGFTAQDFIQAGEAARKAKRYEEALRWYGRASILGADLQSAQWFVVFQADQDWEALEKSVLIDHGWVDEEMRLRAWLRWGAYLHDQQRDVEAEVVLKRAIATSPEAPALFPLLSEMYRFLGLSQWAQGKMSEAVQSMKRAVELNDQNTWAHIHYGKVLYLFDPRLVYQTEHEFAIALEKNPGVEIWRNLISFWRWVGEIERANQMCSQAISVGLAADLVQECPER